MDIQSHLLTKENVQAFLFAGNSTFTLRNSNSGNRFTFKLRKPKKVNDKLKSVPFFLSIMTGSDNEKSYTFAGTLFDKFAYRHSNKSQLNAANPAIVVFSRFLNFLERNTLPASVEVWHEGTCGCCGRKLTTPESLLSGIGPACNKKRWEVAQRQLKLTLNK